MLLSRILFAALVLTAATAGAQPTERAKAIDGDTLVLADGTKVRLLGIDAPDGPPAQKAAARKHLQALMNEGDVSCRTGYIENWISRAMMRLCFAPRESYGRINATCTAGPDRKDLGGQMVSDGYAVSWTKYDCGYYAFEEQLAASSLTGLWGSAHTEMQALATKRGSR